MIVSSSNLENLFIGYKTLFKQGFTGAKSYYKDMAMVVPSQTAAETYAWLGQLPRLREWVGERVLKSLSAHGYTIENKTFESSITVKRNDIADDNAGLYGPLFEELGKSAAEVPDELVFGLLSAGFERPCYDGQNFFDQEHPIDKFDLGKGVVSNFTPGAGEPWFLLDTSRAIKPLIYQERESYELQKADYLADTQVIMTDKFMYGVRGRSNAGFGLWQLAHGSMGTLNEANYVLARTAMQSLRGDEGRLMGVLPDTLVVGPGNESAARRLINGATKENGESNVWAGTAKLIITPWLAA